MSLFNKIKTVKKTVAFNDALSTVNLTAKSTLSGAVLPSNLEGVALSDAFVFTGDGFMIKVDCNGNVVYNDLFAFKFDGKSFCGESVLFEGKRYLHISDGQKAVMIDFTNGQAIEVSTVGVTSVWHKGRLFLSDGKIIRSSATFDPTTFGNGVNISFMPYEDLGEIIAMTEYCNKIYAFFEKGAIAFTEKDGAVCELERLLTFGVDILANSVKKVDKSIYFCATDGVYRVMGRNFYKLSTFSTNSVATAVFDGKFWVKTSFLGDEKILAFSDGNNLCEYSTDTVGIVGGKLVLLEPIENVFGECKIKLSTGVGYKCLKTIKLHAEKEFEFTVFTANGSKKFTACNGENSFIVNLYGNEFLALIKTTVCGQVISRFEYEYYE